MNFLRSGSGVWTPPLSIQLSPVIFQQKIMEKAFFNISWNMMYEIQNTTPILVIDFQWEASS